MDDRQLLVMKFSKQNLLFEQRRDGTVIIGPEDIFPQVFGPLGKIGGNTFILDESRITGQEDPFSIIESCIRVFFLLNYNTFAKMEMRRGG